MSPSENTSDARESANLKSLLQPEVPEGLVELLGSCRPFGGATLALMMQTKNEWLRRVPAAEMENSMFASLSWLYIQVGPLTEVRRVVWNLNDFREAVLDWSNEEVNGKPRITPEVLSAVDAIIQETLGLVESAQVSVKERPGIASGPAETPPPNS